MKQTILIIDYGSQYTQLIARKIREIEVFCLVYPFHKINLKLIKNLNPNGLILSGGPASVLKDNSPKLEKFFFKLNIPILGICYGLQLICYELGGKINQSKIREYGYNEIKIINSSLLFSQLNKNNQQVWMSHGDHVKKIPKKFKITSKSKNNIIASIENKNRNIYGLQFHPEVYHTVNGKKILSNFAFKICKIKDKFKLSNFKNDKINELKLILKNKKVICGVSGGIDSTVTSYILNEAIKKNLYCIFVDNGLLRKNESKEVTKIFKKKFGKNFIKIHASSLFLKRLKNVKDPEMKRKIIGKTFIEVFENKSNQIKNLNFLAQGTLYPDIIESVPFFGGPTAKIKSHHNVGGLPKKMKLKIIEPLKELFKDEVRSLGLKLKIDKSLIERHPFPGPGLAIRIPGKIDIYKIKLLQEVDHIFISYLKEKNIYEDIWQAFAVLIPIKSVGVMGDSRTYEYCVSLRAVKSVDGMTADFFMFNKIELNELSNRIINNVKGVNRVLYDVTSKPPATIEWE